MVKVVLFIVISLAYDCGVGLAAFPYAGEVLKKTHSGARALLPVASKGFSAWILFEGISFVEEDFGLAVGCTIIAVMCLWALLRCVSSLPETAGVEPEHRGRLRCPPCPSCSWHRAILSP